LNRSGGISQRLLDSASLDRPSEASRRHATNLAATASAFSSSTSGSSSSSSSAIAQSSQRRPPSGVRVATWLVVGAAASVTIGLVGAKLLQTPSAPHAAAPLLTAAEPRGAAASSPDIAPEPATPVAPSTLGARPSPDEAREIEAARAALSRGDTDTAIAQLDAYDSAHPNGQLKPEAMALRIQALIKSGKTAEARTLSNEFQEKYPGRSLPGK
jgi:TolA-binding protein